MMMTTPAMHWAHPLIGAPWTPERNCWWLVRHYFAARHGVQMPALSIAPGESAVAALLQAVQVSGWRRAADPAREDDVLLMRGPLGGRHVGVIVEAAGLVGVLHNDGQMTSRGPRGHVVFQSLADLAADGYDAFELWRKGRPS